MVVSIIIEGKSSPAGRVMELFQLVDENGNPIGQAPRSECHGNPRLIHSVVHLHVLDSWRRIFLQRRALTKDTNPGRWDTSVGGHVTAGERIEEALLREAREELGIDASGARRLYEFLYHSGSFETEYAFCFSLEYDGEISVDFSEIQEGRFFHIDEIRRMLGTGLLTPMFEHEFPLLCAALGP
jgi:isopentenyl-diphosphate delta-isomerase type 1